VNKGINLSKDERIKIIGQFDTQISDLTECFLTLNNHFSAQAVSTETLNGFADALKSIMAEAQKLQMRKGGAMKELARNGDASAVQFHISKNKDDSYKIELEMTGFPKSTRTLVHPKIDPKIVYGFSENNLGVNTKHDGDWLQKFTGIEVVKSAAIIEEERIAREAELRAALPPSPSWFTPVERVSSSPAEAHSHTRSNTIRAYASTPTGAQSDKPATTVLKPPKEHNTRTRRYEQLLGLGAKSKSRPAEQMSGAKSILRDTRASK